METPKKIKNMTRKCITPTFRNLSCRETYHFGSETLHRSFSYNELWSPGKDGNGTAITQVTVSCCKSPSIAVQRNKRKKLTYENLPCKKFKPSGKSKLKYTFTMLIIGAIGALIIGWNVMSCREKVFNDGLYEKLQGLVYGQDIAISNIIKGLDELKDIDNVLLTFFGPVGVGKSYAAEIIKNNFPNQNSIVVTYADDLIMKNELPLIMSPCWRLMIIEDCKENNVEKIFNIINSSGSIHSMLFILTVTSTSMLNNYVNNWPYFAKQPIIFSHLSADSIEKCFIKELEKYSYKLNSRELSKLVAEQMQFINEVNDLPGCKLVNEKIVKYFAEVGYVP